MVHTCRGTISLHGAIIHTEDSCTFVISNGSTQTFHPHQSVGELHIAHQHGFIVTQRRSILTTV